MDGWMSRRRNEERVRRFVVDDDDDDDDCLDDITGREIIAIGCWWKIVEAMWP